jgi:hypothetical protein
MSRQIRVKLLLVLVLVGALVGVLSTPDSQNAYAAPCCESCEAGENYCINNCYINGSPPSCYDACYQQWDSCFRYCRICYA